MHNTFHVKKKLYTVSKAVLCLQVHISNKTVKCLSVLIAHRC